MGTWPRHINRFDQKYNKSFARDLFFGADFMDGIHKCVHVFLHSYNTTIEGVELGALAEFGGLQNKVERGEFLTSTPVWVYRPAQKEEGRRKSDGHSMGARPGDGGGWKRHSIQTME